MWGGIAYRDREAAVGGGGEVERWHDGIVESSLTRKNEPVRGVRYDETRFWIGSQLDYGP